MRIKNLLLLVSMIFASASLMASFEDDTSMIITDIDDMNLEHARDTFNNIHKATRIRSQQQDYLEKNWELAVSRALTPFCHSYFKKEIRSTIEQIDHAAPCGTDLKERLLLYDDFEWTKEHQGIKLACKSNNKLRALFQKLGYTKEHPNERGIGSVESLPDSTNAGISMNGKMKLGSLIKDNQLMGVIAHEIAHHRLKHGIITLCMKHTYHPLLNIEKDSDVLNGALKAQEKLLELMKKEKDFKQHRMYYAQFKKLKEYLLKGMKLSRIHEQQADVMAGLWFGKRAIISLISYLNEISTSDYHNDETYLSHPNSQKRVEYLTRLVCIMSYPKTKPELYQQRTRAELLKIFKR